MNTPDTTPGLDPRFPKEDSRPQLGWWAPGGYLCRCRRCDDYFAGDKRAGICADCAYAGDSDITHPTE